MSANNKIINQEGPMGLQKHFNSFHETIKLNEYDENADLRERRDDILSALRDGLKTIAEENEEDKLTFSHFNQGSYSMKTGIIPDKGEYDIDVGLKFNIKKDDFEDPSKLKLIIKDALLIENYAEKDIDIKKPCITVNCERTNENGEIEKYHVDLAIYSNEENNDNKELYLARGTYNGNSEWIPATPEYLRDKINEYAKNEPSESEKRMQFRRIVRYLKKWKSVKFKENGDSAPSGIGLTVACFNWLYNSFDSNNTPNDFDVLFDIVDKMISKFNFKFNVEENGFEERLIVKLEDKYYNWGEIKPDSDFFSKMTKNQSESFKNKLITFRDVLSKVSNEDDDHESTKLLRTLFGEDFPLAPETESRESNEEGCFVGSSASA